MQQMLLTWHCSFAAQCGCGACVVVYELGKTARTLQIYTMYRGDPCLFVAWFYLE